MSLSGVRGGFLYTADRVYNQFTRSYAGYRITQPTGSVTVPATAWNGGLSSSTTEDRNILTGTVTSGLGSASTGTGVNRMEIGKTADIAFTITRSSSTEFTLSYTIDIVGGTGTQNLSYSAWAPSGDFFLPGNAFTTFAIGYEGFANGNAMNITNLQVTVIPEPSTYALLGLGLGAFALLRRRRKG